MSSSMILGVSAVLAAALVALAGCGEPFVAGSGSGGEGTGGSGAGGSSSSSSMGGGGGVPSCAGPGEACGDCVASSCPAAYCPCVGNSACEKLAACYAQCQPGDVLWQQYCRGQSPSAITNLALIGHCEATLCSAECGGAGNALDPCTFCMFTDCEQSVEACFGDPMCAKAAECVSNCSSTDTTCLDACLQQNPGAAGKLADLRACQKDQCASVCN